MLALDLGVFQRKLHFPSIREALTWSLIWIGISILFNFLILHELGHTKALEFFTGYVIEKALSVDNIFVFVLIFTYFRVPLEYQHKVLFWGVVGAVIMRALFILIGAALVASFHWILYIFGAFLIYTSIMLARGKHEEIHPEHNPILKVFRKFFPVSNNFEGSKFFVRREGRLFATPLFLVLIVVESTDVVFAADSIPAIFAVTRDPVIAYTSNILAILGLRSLYFVLAGFIKKFRYLKTGLSFVLAFIGLKMILEPFYHLPIHFSLMMIVLILAASVIASISANKKAKASSKE